MIHMKNFVTQTRQINPQKPRYRDCPINALIQPERGTHPGDFTDLLSKAPYEVSTGGTEYRLIKSLFKNRTLKRNEKIWLCVTFGTNLWPLMGKNFSAACPLFRDILGSSGSSPQGESFRIKVPFGFIGCFNVPSLICYLI